MHKKLKVRLDFDTINVFGHKPMENINLIIVVWYGHQRFPSIRKLLRA